MFHVVTCRKFTQQTIRIVECEDIEKVLNGDMGECLLCGPCSHVEVGKREDYWTVLSSHDTELQATESAWSELERVGLKSGRYDMSYLPKQPEAARR